MTQILEQLGNVKKFCCRGQHPRTDRKMHSSLSTSLSYNEGQLGKSLTSYTAYMYCLTFLEPVY